MYTVQGREDGDHAYRQKKLSTIPELELADTAKNRVTLTMSRPMSPNGALPIIPPHDVTRGEVHSSNKQGSESVTPGPSSPAAVSKKVTFGSPISNDVHIMRHDMRSDDEEFAIAAQQILRRIQADDQREETNLLAEILQDGVDVIWSFGSSESIMDHDEEAIPVMTAQFLADFDIALKYRMKRLPFRTSGKETDVEQLTRTVTFALASCGYPRPEDHLAYRKECPDEPRVDTEAQYSVSLPGKADVGLLGRLRQCFFPDNESSGVGGIPVEAPGRSSSSVPKVDRSFEKETVIVRDSNFKPMDKWQVNVLSEAAPLCGDDAVASHASPANSLWKGREQRTGARNSRKELKDEELGSDNVDRAFEDSIVVIRESRLIDLSALQASAKQDSEEQSVNLRQVSNEVAVLRKLSIERQSLVEESRRVQGMVRSTRNESVRISCRRRLEQLRLKLRELSGSDPLSIRRSRGRQSGVDNGRQQDAPRRLSL